jgi:hypothetical protein
MVLPKYAALGFDIIRFGKHALALRFENKPIFIFEPDLAIDEEFFNSICETYLKLSAKRKNLSCIKG